jgi:hypothetical protein
MKRSFQKVSTVRDCTTESTEESGALEWWSGGVVVGARERERVNTHGRLL